MKTKKPHKNSPSKDKRFLNALDRVIDFHANNHNDPHGVSRAVMVAVLEVRDAFAASRSWGRKTA